ncbi:hypothetical protein AA313_de0208257 [Arthrobotrys entomopaga]|nr:hypothetical protein AA313_de0208257 [Arthrobotrys entomopaga]
MLNTTSANFAKTCGVISAKNPSERQKKHKSIRKYTRKALALVQDVASILALGKISSPTGRKLTATSNAREEAASGSNNKPFASGWEMVSFGSDFKFKPLSSASETKPFICGSENKPFASTFDPRGDQGLRTREHVAGTALKTGARVERDPYLVNGQSKNFTRLDDVVHREIAQFVRKEKYVNGFGGATKYSPESKTPKPHIECFSCEKLFPSMYAMIAHLESGDCTSKITRGDVNHTFASHPRSEALMPKDGRKTLSALLSYGECEKPFQCSNVNCNAVYKRLSGLICHAESGHCRLKFESGYGSMLDHMKTCVFRQSVIRKIEVLGASTRFGIYICPPPSKVYQCFQKDAGPLCERLSDLISHVVRLNQHPSLGEPGSGQNAHGHGQNGGGSLFGPGPVKPRDLPVSIADAISKIRKELRNLDTLNSGKVSHDISISFEQSRKMRPIGWFLEDVQLILSLIDNNTDRLGRVSEMDIHVF